MGSQNGLDTQPYIVIFLDTWLVWTHWHSVQRTGQKTTPLAPAVGLVQAGDLDQEEQQRRLKLLTQAGWEVDAVTSTWLSMLFFSRLVLKGIDFTTGHMFSVFFQGT